MNEDRATTEEPSRLFRLVDSGFHGAIALIALFWAADLAVRFNLLVFTEQVLAAILMFAVAVAFVVTDPRGQVRFGGPVPWYDWTLCAIALAVFAYVCVDYPRLSQNIYFNAEEAFALSVVMVLLVLEALRRTTGLSLLIVFLVFFVYALIADQVPGALQGRTTELYRLMPLLGIDATALFGTPLAIVVTVVIAFVFMGQLLFVTGGGDFFTDLSAAMMGRTRGGAAKISIVASAMFGSVSGSVVANVTSTGVITIPLMRKAGFRPKVAGAVEAVASNGGQLMPPVMGAAAFLMADFLGISYVDVLIAAILPALLYFLAVFIQVDIEAARWGIRAEARETTPRVLSVLRQGWVYPVPFAVLLTGIFQLNMPPEKAAIYASAALVGLTMLFPVRGRRLSLSDIWQAIVGTGRAAVTIAVICGVAGMIIGVLNITGLGFALGLMLLQAGQGSLFLLLVLTGIVCILLGMSMPTTSLYILLSTLAAPSLIQLGALPIAAHLFVLYYGMMSFITPPVAFAAFAAANIARAGPMETGFMAMRLGWLAYVIPFLFVYSPTLLLQGSWHAVLLAAVTAVFGIWLVSGAIMGMLITALTPLRRIAAGVSGAALLVPADAFDGALAVEVAGLLLGLVVAIGEFRGARPSRQSGKEHEPPAPTTQ